MILTETELTTVSCLRPGDIVSQDSDGKKWAILLSVVTIPVKKPHYHDQYACYKTKHVHVISTDGSIMSNYVCADKEIRIIKNKKNKKRV